MAWKWFRQWRERQAAKYLAWMQNGMQESMHSRHSHDFEWALGQMDKGGKVARLGWVADGRWVMKPITQAYVFYMWTGTMTQWRPADDDLNAKDWGRP